MDSWPNLFLFCGVGGAAAPAPPGSQQPGAKQMFRRGRGAARSRAPRRPRSPWRRPGRLLSRSTLSRPLSDYLHLRSVRHTARILIRFPPSLPAARGAHPPLPSPLPLRLPHPWDSLRTVGASLMVPRQEEGGRCPVLPCLGSWEEVLCTRGHLWWQLAGGSAPSTVF